MLFDGRSWFVLLEYPKHDLRQSVRVLAYFPQCCAQRIGICIEHRVNTSSHSDHLVTVFWHFFAKHEIFVVISPRLRRIRNIPFFELVNLFIRVSEFFAKPFGDCRVAIALLALYFGEDGNAFRVLPLIHGFLIVSVLGQVFIDTISLEMHPFRDTPASSTTPTRVILWSIGVFRKGCHANSHFASIFALYRSLAYIFPTRTLDTHHAVAPFSLSYYVSLSIRSGPAFSWPLYCDNTSVRTAHQSPHRPRAFGQLVARNW